MTGPAVRISSAEEARELVRGLMSEDRELRQERAHEGMRQLIDDLVDKYFGAGAAPAK